VSVVRTAKRLYTRRYGSSRLYDELILEHFDRLVGSTDLRVRQGDRIPADEDGRLHCRRVVLLTILWHPFSVDGDVVGRGGQ
jgi:hypothetical protein